MPDDIRQYGRVLDNIWMLILQLRQERPEIVIHLNNIEQFKTIFDNIRRYWAVSGNIGKYQAILDDIGQYGLVFLHI